MKTCNCPELKIVNGDGDITQIPAPDYPGVGRHDCAEVRRRNSFLPTASAEATRLAGGDPGDPGWGNRYTSHLSRQMEKSCKE